MQAVREGRVIVYKSSNSWSLPGPVPDDLNIYHALKGDTTDDRYTTSTPTWIDPVTDEERTLPQAFEKADYLARALLTIPQIVAARETEETTSIGLLSYNHIDYPVAIISSTQIGVPFAAMSSASKVLEIEHFIKVANIVTLLVHPNLLAVAVEARKAFKNHIPIITFDLPNAAPTPFPSVSSLVKLGSQLPSLPSPTVPKSKLAWIVFSSGTTALPKAVLITHKNVLAHLMGQKAQIEAFRAAAMKTGILPPINSAVERTITLGVLPMYHVFGLILFAIRPMTQRFTVIVTKGWKIPTALKHIEKYRVNLLALVPTMAVQLVASPLLQQADCSSLRVFYSGASYLSPETRTRLEEIFKSRGAGKDGDGPLRFGSSNGYGMSECVVSCCSGTVEGMPCGPHPRDSLGLLVPGLDGRLVDSTTGQDIPLGSGKPGELWVRGPVVMKGYSNAEANEEAFVYQDGERWFRTGDEFRIDEKGFLWYNDRLKEVFKHKGLQVTPTEIIGVINDLPFIFDSAVSGMPAEDVAAGEEAWAWVVIREEYKNKMSEEEIKQQVFKIVQSKLARHKWLKKVLIIDAIPSVPSGKKLTRQLKQEALKNLKTKSKL